MKYLPRRDRLPVVVWLGVMVALFFARQQNWLLTVFLFGFGYLATGGTIGATLDNINDGWASKWDRWFRLIMSPWWAIVLAMVVIALFWLGYSLNVILPLFAWLVGHLFGVYESLKNLELWQTPGFQEMREFLIKNNRKGK